MANDIYEVVSFFIEDARIVTDLCIVDPNQKQGTKYLKYQVCRSIFSRNSKKKYITFYEVNGVSTSMIHAVIQNISGEPDTNNQ